MGETTSSSPRSIRLASRGRTYAGIVGTVAALLVAGLALPFAVGEPASSLRTVRPADGGPGDAGASDEVGATTTSTNVDSPTVPDAPGRPGGPSSVTTAPRGPLTATDRGVTATSVKVGVLIADAGAVQRTGFAGEGTDPDSQKATWRALQRSVNAQGGIEGRAMELVFAGYNPLAADSMRAACLSLTQDAKVFAVLNITAFYGDPVLCVTEQNTTPLVLGPGQSEEYYARSPGRLFTTGMSRVRLLRTSVAALDAAGSLRGRTIGIVEGSARDNTASTDAGFIAELERRGYRVAKRVQLGELGVAQTQIPLAVNQLKDAGVDLLLTMHNPIVVTSFVQQAEAQGYRPTYLATDLGLMTSDLATQNMPDSYDGAVGFTVGRTNEHRQGLPEPAVDAACIDRIATQGIAEPERGTPSYASMLGACGVLDAFLAGTRGAGTDLTRTRFGAAMAAVGPIDLPGQGPASFTPGKPDAPNAVRPLRWRLDCTCWMPSGPFTPGS